MASRRTTPFVLDISKLNEVINVLKLYNFPEAKWFKFGLKLGLLYTTLTAITSDHGADAGRCLMECLAKWLSKADIVSTVTWQTLASALQKMDEKAVAERVSKTMAAPASQLLQHYSGRLSKVVLSKGTVQLLHTEGVISVETAVEVEIYSSLLVGDPLIAICIAVAGDHNKFKLLASILLQTDKPLANEMIQEYEETFPCSSVAVTSPTQPVTPATVESSSTTVPTEGTTAVEGNTTQAGHVMKVPIGHAEKVKFDEIRDDRGCLLHKIFPCIEDSVPVKDLKILLKRCRPEMEPQLKQAESFDVVIELIEEKCSVINISLLEHIVTVYSIEEAKVLISDYKTKLEKFCSLVSSLIICKNIQLKTFSSSQLTCETIQFTLDWKIDEHTLNDIIDLLSKAFSKMANRVEVVVIREGNSITVTCYVPHYLMESLLVVARGNLDLLKKMGLISLTIGYYTVYDQRGRDEEMRSLEKRLHLAEEEKDTALYRIHTAVETLLEGKEKDTQKGWAEVPDLKQLHTLYDTSSSVAMDITPPPPEESSQEQQQLEEARRKRNNSMSSELDYLLSSKKVLTEELMESKKDNEILQEKISSLSEQLKIQRKDQSTQSEKEVDKLESIQLFQFAMTAKEVDIPTINDIRNNPCSIDKKAALFLKSIEESPLLLAELRDTKEGTKNGKVDLGTDVVRLISPSRRQCQEVISQLQESHFTVGLENSSSIIVNLLVPSLLTRLTLKGLSITSTPLTLDNIRTLSESLSANKSLKTLSLRSSMTDNEVGPFVQSLQGNSTLVHLFLSSNPGITDSSVNILSQLICSNSTLTELSLYGTSLTSAGVPHLLKALTSNTTLERFYLGSEHKTTCSSSECYELIKYRLFYK